MHRPLAHVNRTTNVPDRSLIMLSSLAMVMIIVFYIFNADLQTALLIQSGAAIIVYIIGSSASIRLFETKGWRRALP
jgi:amino acid transporter